MTKYFTDKDWGMLVKAIKPSETIEENSLFKEIESQANHYAQLYQAINALYAAFSAVKALDPEVARKFLIEKEKEC